MNKDTDMRKMTKDRQITEFSVSSTPTTKEGFEFWFLLLEIIQADLTFTTNKRKENSSVFHNLTPYYSHQSFPKSEDTQNMEL